MEMLGACESNNDDIATVVAMVVVKRGQISPYRLDTPNFPGTTRYGGILLVQIISFYTLDVTVSYAMSSHIGQSYTETRRYWPEIWNKIIQRNIEFALKDTLHNVYPLQCFTGGNHWIPLLLVA